MPKTTSSGKPKQSELPSTLQNSSGKAQRTFTKAYDAAIDQYGDERRALQVAFAALKHTHEKVGDKWKRKDRGRKGPSDARAAGGRDTNRPTAGGVDANASKRHLYDLAKQLKIPGRSSMSKPELVAALQKANDRATARSREKKSPKSSRASKGSKKTRR
ncbi:MAG TPA: ChaB family protein [Microlunatus sp.]|nr:ChaB family protein [Microlunatus sp.]